MADKIVSRSFSKQGLDNWDKIFKKDKKEEEIKPADYPGNWDDAQFLNNWEQDHKKTYKCDSCGEEAVFYGHVC